MRCRIVLPALLVAGLCLAGTEARAYTLRSGDWVQKDSTQKGQVQKGCEQKAMAPRLHARKASLLSGLHVQKGAVQKGCEQKADPCVQKGAVQKAPHLHRGWMPRLNVQKAAPCAKGCEPKGAVQKGAVQKGCEQKAPAQKHCVQKGQVQKAK